jgi:signal transduction histidine kinase
VSLYDRARACVRCHDYKVEIVTDSEVKTAHRRQPTDAALFREISASTIFESSEPGETQRWINALADLIDDIFATHETSRPSKVILDHAIRFTNADTAILCMPIDADRMEIRNARGQRGPELIGQTFDRRTSIAGRVLDSGQSAFVDMPRLKSPIEEVRWFGPMIITPLLGLRALGTLGVTRLHNRSPFTAADLGLVAGFAGLATVALHVDEARAVREEASIGAEHDRLAFQLLDSLISSLFKVSMGVDRLVGLTRDPELQDGLRGITGQLDGLIAGIRRTIYATRPPTRTGALDL